MKPFLMGAETEYAVSGRSRSGPLSPREVHNLLLDVLRRERLCIEDVTGCHALYLENGARLYLDYGEHPEYATPECFTPAQVVAYDKAGEALLALARRVVPFQQRGHEITILKNNLHTLYPNDITWGSHESYTCWAQPEVAAEALLPHLVSRTLYAGSGCLSSYAGGMGFELSQRARHVEHVIGTDTTSERALYCTRIRKQSDRSAAGWMRAHLISKDSHRAPLGIYLTYGVTGMLFLLLNEGHSVGKGLKLADPIRALRQISSDPWLHQRVELVDGRRLTALEIQQAYLDECYSIMQAGEFPDWTREVLTQWERTLTTLAKDPLRMANQLDPYYKLLVFDHELGRVRLGWNDLRDTLAKLTVLRDQFSSGIVNALLTESTAGLTPEEEGQLVLARSHLGSPSSRMLDQLRLAVRLQQFDVAYHEVGGMYDEMLAAGHLHSVIVTPHQIEEATRAAPPGGRAALRSQCIKLFRDPGWICEWRYLYHGDTDEFVDLRDPFTATFAPSYLARVSKEEPENTDLLEIAGQIGRR